MVMPDWILALLFVIWIFLTVFFLIFLSANSDNESKSIISYSKEFVESLFIGRNIFGILISLFVFVLFIPSIVLIFLYEILYLAIKLFCYIWRLGDKNYFTKDVEPPEVTIYINRDKNKFIKPKLNKFRKEK